MELRLGVESSSWGGETSLCVKVEGQGSGGHKPLWQLRRTYFFNHYNVLFSWIFIHCPSQTQNKRYTNSWLYFDMFVYYDWPFPHMCTLQRMQRISLFSWLRFQRLCRLLLGNNNNKYSSLPPDFIFQPVAIETLDSLNASALTFISDVGRRLTSLSGNLRETSFLFQRLSMLIQRFNSALIMDYLCFSDADPDL